MYYSHIILYVIYYYVLILFNLNWDLIYIISFILIQIILIYGYMCCPLTSAICSKTECNDDCLCKARNRIYFLSVFRPSRMPASGHKPPNAITKGRLIALCQCQGLGGWGQGQEGGHRLPEKVYTLSDAERITLVDSISFNSTNNTQKLLYPPAIF